MANRAHRALRQARGHGAEGTGDLRSWSETALKAWLGHLGPEHGLVANQLAEVIRKYRPEVAEEMVRRFDPPPPPPPPRPAPDDDVPLPDPPPDLEGDPPF